MGLEILGDVCIASGGTFAAPASFTPIPLIGECSVENTRDKIDSPKRGRIHKGYKLGRQDTMVKGKIVKEIGNAGYEAIRDAKLNGTPIHIVLLDGPYDEVGSEGPNADFYVETFNRAGDIDGEVVYDFTLIVADTANVPTWYEKTA